jgi:hypothetical protein
MPEPIQVDVDEQGNIGTLPAPLQSFLDKAINEAYKRGASKAERELSGKTIDPAERERLKQVEADAQLLREEIATRDKNYEEAARLREERYAKQLAEREETARLKDAEIGRRDARLRSMLGAEIRAAAVAAGARDESIPELVKLLGADIDLDENLDPFVRGEGNSPRLVDGKPMSIEGLVSEYLGSHPHHLRGGRSTPGRAQGGAAFRQTQTPQDAAHEDAMAAVAADPSTRTLTQAVRSIRTRATAGGR